MIRDRSHFALITDDTDIMLHDLLQIALHRVRILARAVLKWLQHLPRIRVKLVVIDFVVWILPRKPGRKFAGAFSKDNEIGERVTAKPIRAIDSGGALAGRK